MPLDQPTPLSPTTLGNFHRNVRLASGATVPLFMWVMFHRLFPHLEDDQRVLVEMLMKYPGEVRALLKAADGMEH